MKKLLLIVILFMPFFVNAETKFSVYSKVIVEGNEIKDNQFTFNLKDNKGNIIKTVKNDSDGNIVFSDVLLPDGNGNDFLMYYIEEENDGQIGYTYDDRRIYVKVPTNYSETNKQIYYYKDKSLEEKMEKEIPIYEYKEPYHATDEELKGEAYAVLDFNTETLYFRRFENLDTSSFDSQFDQAGSGDKDRAVDLTNGYMYLRNVENNKSKFTDSLLYCYHVNGSEKCPRRVVFEDAFKPTFTDGSELFYRLGYYAEEVDFSHFDSSNITNMREMFLDTKLKKLDLSTFDTSNVENMEYMFLRSELETLDLSSFTFEAAKNMYGMFQDSKKLTTIKIPSTSKTNKVEIVAHLFHNCESLELMDVSWLVINKDTQTDYLFANSKLKYLDLSHWNFTLNSRSGLSFLFFGMDCLKYLDISNIKTPITGSTGSADYSLSDSVEVLKISQEFNPVYHMTKGLEKQNYFFNIEIMDFNNDITTYNRESKYYEGGTYLNVNELEVASFINKYVEPITEEEEVPEEKEVPEEPNTTEDSSMEVDNPNNTKIKENESNISNNSSSSTATEQNMQNNPDTVDMIYAILFLFIFSLSLVLYFYKRKMKN